MCGQLECAALDAMQRALQQGRPQQPQANTSSSQNNWPTTPAGEEVNPHSEDHMSPSAREKMLSDEASRIADESGP